MKLLSIIGTRPQLIKASVLSKQFQKDKINHSIINSGQHYDSNLSDIFFKELFETQINIKNIDLKPKSEINFYSKIFNYLEKEIKKIKPDLVICYGDTNTTLSAALVASKMKIDLVHIEAGLRDLSLRPEETNRILVDKLSKYLFCPTPDSYENLKIESKFNPHSQFFYSGDVMKDLFENSKKLFKKPKGFESTRFALVTLHRQENVDDEYKLNEISTAFKEISKEVEIIIPLHPRTKKMLDKFGIDLNCTVISPQGYLEFQWMLKNCEFVITDSGGVQKESFFHNKKCILIMDGNTAWSELQNSGYFYISQAKKEKILLRFDQLSKENSSKKSHIDNIFGNGDACKIISNELKKVF